MKIQTSIVPALNALTHSENGPAHPSQPGQEDRMTKRWPPSRPSNPITEAAGGLVRGTVFWGSVGNNIAGPTGALFMGAVGGAASSLISFVAALDGVFE